MLVSSDSPPPPPAPLLPPQRRVPAVQMAVSSFEYTPLVDLSELLPEKTGRDYSTLQAWPPIMTGDLRTTIVVENGKASIASTSQLNMSRFVCRQ